MSAVDVANNANYSFLANGDLVVEGGAIIYRNFSGQPTKFNPNGGKRTFALVIPQEVADELVDRGWNVKHRPPRDEDEDDMYYTEIVVNMGSEFPPRVNLVTKYGEKENMTPLTEDNISLLDTSILTNIDMVIHPYAHGRMNAAGATVKGYLKTMYATNEPVVDFGGKYNRFME